MGRPTSTSKLCRSRSRRRKRLHRKADLHRHLLSLDPKLWNIAITYLELPRHYPAAPELTLTTHTPQVKCQLCVQTLDRSRIKDHLKVCSKVRPHSLSSDTSKCTYREALMMTCVFGVISTQQLKFEWDISYSPSFQKPDVESQLICHHLVYQSVLDVVHCQSEHHGLFLSGHFHTKPSQWELQHGSLQHGSQWELQHGSQLAATDSLPSADHSHDYNYHPSSSAYHSITSPAWYNSSSYITATGNIDLTSAGNKNSATGNTTGNNISIDLSQSSQDSDSSICQSTSPLSSTSLEHKEQESSLNTTSDNNDLVTLTVHHLATPYCLPQPSHLNQHHPLVFSVNCEQIRHTLADLPPPTSLPETTRPGRTEFVAIKPTRLSGNVIGKTCCVYPPHISLYNE